MQKLIEGLHDFHQNIFSKRREFFESLANGQSPEALFITCSDSRVNPNLITQTDPGELFIIRNAGNIVPAFGPTPGGEAATIEFAIKGLQVKDIIVCGHSGCGAMKALLDPTQTAALPSMKSWLAHAEATRQIIAQSYGHLDGEALLTATVQENVLVQIEHLRTHPAVAAALSASALRLHGWAYKLETGEVFTYDVGDRQFAPLVSTEKPKPPARGRAAAI